MKGKHLLIGLIFIGLLAVGFYLFYSSYGEGSVMYKYLNEENLLSKEELALLSPMDVTPDKFSTYQLTIDNGLKISYDNWSITFQPYFVMNNGQVYAWNQIPSSIEKTLWKKELTPLKYKYGADFSNIPQSVKDNLKYIVFHRSDVQNLTFSDINITGNSIRIKNKLTINHNDFLRDYTIVSINSTDIVLGDIQGRNETYYNGTIYFKENFIPNGDGTYFITFDPTVTLDGTTSYDSIDTNITQETGFAHLNISNTAPYDSLVFYMPFDSNVSTTTTYDYSGNGNDGTVNGNTFFNSSGKYGGALQFDGTGDYVETPSISIANNITVSSWVYSSDFNQNGVIAVKNPVNQQWMLWFENNLTRLRGGSTSGNVGCSTPSNNEWSNVVGVITGTNGELFINGVSCGTATVTAINNGAGLINLGRFDNGYYFTGMIDEVMIFNTSLTASQVLEIYNNQSARFASQGTQLFNNTNVSSSGNENRLNITLTDYQNLLGSNISVGINGTYFNLSSDGTINNLEFTSDPNFLNITFKYIAGTNQFYSPLLIGNITLDSWAVSGATDNEYPIFSNYWDDNASLVGSGTGLFNVTVTSTDGTVWLEINGVNTTATNLTANVYNASYAFSGSGTYTYRWHSWGNGTSNNYNVSNDQSYTVNPIPLIEFVSPTPANGTTTTNTSIEIWTNITEANLKEVKFNWNQTNTSFLDGLVLAYNFNNLSALGEDDTLVYDISGNGNNGTVTGATFNSTGRYGGAYDFNDDYISGSSIPLNNQSFTFSSWVKYVIKQDGEDSHTIFTPNWNYGSNLGYGWQIVHNNGANGTQRLYLGNGVTVSSSVVPSSGWHYVAVTHNGSTVSFYLDGVLDGTSSQTIRGDAVGSFFIGKESPSASWRDFNGSIDELRVYNRSLSASDIQQLYYSNLKKYDTDKWQLYVNQSGLNVGTYTYQAFAEDKTGNLNQTDLRSITITSADTCSPSSPLSANYQFECSDNCVQSTVLDAGGNNLVFNGAGTFTASANINNIGNWFVRTGCKVIINSGITFGIWITFIKDILLI